MKVVYTDVGECTLDGERVCVCKAEQGFVKYLAPSTRNAYRMQQEKWEMNHGNRRKLVTNWNKTIESKKAAYETIREEKKKQLLSVSDDPNYSYSVELVGEKRKEIAMEILAINKDLDKLRTMPNPEYHPLPMILFGLGIYLARKEIENDDYTLQDDGDRAWLQVGEKRIELDELSEDIAYTTSWFVNYEPGNPQMWIKGSNWYTAFLCFNCNSLQ